MTKILSRSRLRTALLVPGALLATGILFAGCSTTSAADTASDRSDTGGSDAAEPPTQGATPAGVTGLIAYAEDGMLQVQSDDEQTAVRYDDDTTVTKTVPTDGGSIAVGDCVLIVTDEEGATATSISITAAADDGTCAAGMGGGMPEGEMPEGAAPSDAPTDGERPEDAPTDAPSGGQGGFGGLVSGTVTAASDGALTVESTGDEAETSEVAYSVETIVTTTVAATTADIATDLCVSAMGEADDAGGYDATSLVLSDPDESGECSTGRGPGGGRPDGQAPGGQTADDDAAEDSGE